MFAWLHMIRLALAVAGFAVAVRRFFSVSPDGLLVAVLAAGRFVSLGSYVSSIIPGTLFDTREIAAVLPFGAVLAGRLLATPLLRARLTLLLGVVAGGYLAALGYGVAQPQQADPERPWPAGSRRMASSPGLGAYTEDNVTTLDSGGGVRADGVLAAVRRRAAGVPVDDLLVLPRGALREVRGHRHRRRVADLTPRREILALAGPPVRTYRPVVHDHGLGHELARRSRLAADAQARNHRPLLTGFPGTFVDHHLVADRDQAAGQDVGVQAAAVQHVLDDAGRVSRCRCAPGSRSRRRGTPPRRRGSACRSGQTARAANRFSEAGLIEGIDLVKINAITVPGDSGDELARRFAARAGAVDDRDGFGDSSCSSRSKSGPRGWW